MISEDARSKRIETKLSQFGALVSLASDEVIEAKARVKAAEEKLANLQAEIEQLYIILNEPFSITIEKP